MTARNNSNFKDINVIIVLIRRKLILITITITRYIFFIAETPTIKTCQEVL
jgi:hypothetical protein